MSRLLKHYKSCKTAFFCCDIQERVRSMDPNFDNCIFVANRFAALHNALGPAHSLYIVSEQYPKSLGPTAAEIQLPRDAHVFSKTQCSMLVPDVLKLVDVPEVEQVVLWGCDAHVCVLHTADGLLGLKKKVFLAVDGCGGQSDGERTTAIEWMRTWGADGCAVTTSESIFLQLLRDAKDPLFKLFLSGGREKHPVPF